MEKGEDLSQLLLLFTREFVQPVALVLTEELQKVLLEQIDFRRRLEQEFHALKGTAPFPVFRKFHRPSSHHSD